MSDPKSKGPVTLSDSAPAAPALPRLVDGRDLARILSVSGRTLKRMVKEGSIPSIIVGDRRRFDPLEVVAHLKRASAKAEKGDGE